MVLPRLHLSGISFILLLSGWSVSADAQSFNCRYAKKPVEVAICQDGSLGRLDELMAETYFDVMNSISSRKAAIVKAEQSDFLYERNRCGYNFECITNVYNARIRELCDWADMSGNSCY